MWVILEAWINAQVVRLAENVLIVYQNFMTDNGFSPSSTVCENIESIKKASFARSFNIANMQNLLKKVIISIKI